MSEKGLSSKHDEEKKIGVAEPEKQTFDVKAGSPQRNLRLIAESFWPAMTGNKGGKIMVKKKT